MGYVLGLIAGLLIAPNIMRWRRKTYVNLGKNCLLTWHPIVFLEGPKSIFYFGRYWNRIPEYLKEIGYDVTTLKLPWRNKKNIESEIEIYLDDLHSRKKQVHLFVDESFLKNFKSRLLKTHPAIATLNVPKSEQSPMKTIDYLSYPSYLGHQLALKLSGWDTNFSPSSVDALLSNTKSPSTTLEQVIHIAEEDFIGSQSIDQTWN